MSQLLEPVHTEENDPQFNMPYSPAIKVVGGTLVYLAGVTAAPLYHSHPHLSHEFDELPADAEGQAEIAVDNLERVLQAAGGNVGSLVEMTRYIVDLDANQDAINRVLGRRLGSHRPATTTVEVVRLATDPRLVLELKAVAVVSE